MKITYKVISFLIFVIFFSVVYLSIIGIETTKFNNQIQSKIKNINKNLSIELKDVKLILNPFKLNFSAKTLGPKIFYKDKFLEIENIKTNISLKSLLKDEFSIESLNISTKSIKIEELISFSRSFYQKPELIILEKILKIKGYLIGDINIRFDSEGNLKDDFIIKGFVKDTNLTLFKNYDLKKLNFVFNFNKDNFVFEDLRLTIDKLNFFSKKIIVKKLNGNFFVEGNFENKNVILDEKNIIYFTKIFDPKFDLKKINFSSENKFSFKVNKKFQVSQLEISSKVKIKDATINNKINLKKIFPEIEDEINLLNNEMNFEYKKNFFSLKGSGDILFQKKKDFISYQLEKNKDDLIFKNLLKIDEGPFLLDFLNYKKNINDETIIKINGKINDNVFLLKSFSLNEGVNNIEINDLIIDKNNRIEKFNNITISYLDKDNEKNSLKIFKDKDYYMLKGDFFNADHLIENILGENTKSNFFINNFRIRLNINKVRIDNDYRLDNLRGELIFKNQKLFNADLIGDFPDNKKVKFIVKSNGNNKVTTFTIDHAKPIVKRYKFIKGFDGGTLDFNSSKKFDESFSQLKIYDFKLKELPLLTKILTLASLQGIADILSGEGIRFSEFEMNFKNKGNLMTIEEIYAIGPAISILMDGYVEKNKLISLRGTLVPATTINKFIGSLPVLGKILVGSKTGEGVFGVSFKIKGPPKKLETSVNPIKTLTPRFITRTLEKIKKN